MKRIVSPLSAAVGLLLALGTSARAQQQPAPEPQLPPMPSMEGQQGDMGKPLTGVPKTKAAPAEPRRAAGPRKAPAPGPRKAGGKAAAKTSKTGTRHRKR